MAGKHVSFPKQREHCRLNKFTYTEKCSCGIVTLMCNYPFSDPAHKKGVCRASTCTDMRKALAEDIAAISGEEETFDQGAEKVSEMMGADKAAGSMAKEPAPVTKVAEKPECVKAADEMLNWKHPEDSKGKKPEGAEGSVTEEPKLVGIDAAYDENGGSGAKELEGVESFESAETKEADPKGAVRAE